MKDRLFTIAPHAPFLKTLIDRIEDGMLTGGWDVDAPFGWADITIILPTRRARLALAAELTKRLGGAALLPDIRTFGGPGAAEEELFLPPFDAPPLPPAISPFARRMLLAPYVASYAEKLAKMELGFSTPPHAGEILALTDSLGQLIDDFTIQQAEPEKLGTVDAGAFADKWQTNLIFLNVIAQIWPEILKERGALDAAEISNRRLAQRTEFVADIFGNKPVIAAGSTGSIPATADFLKAVASLPRGAIVLPGVDTSIDGKQAERLTTGESAAHTHPQYGLSKLLTGWSLAPSDVTELAPAPSPRTQLIRHALSAADDTTDWPQAKAALEGDLAAALEGVSLISARSDEEEARAIALAAHQVLLEQKSVGIISPDQSLARRIAAELQRFDFVVDDSAGVPLFQARAGRLVRQMMAALQSGFAAVDLVALLDNALTGLGYDRAELSRLTHLLELALLRGQHKADGITGLTALIAANLDGTTQRPAYRLVPEEAEALSSLCTQLEAAFAPLAALQGEPHFSIATFGAALAESLSLLTATANGPTVWPQGEEKVLRDWLTEMQRSEGGPQFDTYGIAGALAPLMAGFSVRRPTPAREDIAIWGTLEARLLNPDVLILAGLNEGVWPEAADPGPWLNRQLREAVGLEAPERRQGQAAHDFEMAMGNAEVILAMAQRSGGSPSLPSRLWARLTAFIGEDWTKALLKKGETYLHQARHLDFAASITPAPRPAPNPPVEDRPSSLSVTDVEKLIRSPYDIYAKYVLGLRPLTPLGTEPDARERGQVIHQVFGDFIAGGGDPLAPNAYERLCEIAAHVFAAALPGHLDMQAVWLKRMRPLIAGYLSFERARPKVAQRHAEIDGEAIYGQLKLRGRADRIDEMADGTLAILDFKTGSLPDKAEKDNLWAPQLPLEAHMAAQGAFKSVQAKPVSTLQFLEAKFGREPFKATDYSKGDNPNDLGAAAVEHLTRHAGTVLFSPHPMASRIFPKANQNYAGDYDHLARVAEWTAIDGEGEE